MSSKKWCVVAALAALTAVLSIIGLNVIADPFGVFGDEWYSYNMTNNPRVAKIEYLKKNHEKYDSYIIGCSSTSSYPVEDLNRYMDAKFYNMISYGADMLDLEQTVYYLDKNYEVKNLIVNLYISNGVEYDAEINKMTMSMHADVDGSSKLEFYSKYAFANPKYSFAKLEAEKKDQYLQEAFDVFDAETGAYDKRKRDAEQVSDMDSFYEDYPVFTNYPSWEQHLPYYRECSEGLARVKAYCEEHNINLMVMNSPVYYRRFLDFPKEEIMAYYQALAEVTDFWDFSVTSVSLEPRFFYDDTHFRNDVGRMALARMFGDDSIYIPADFGTYVTRDNVEAYVESFYGKTFSDTEYTKKLPVLLYHHIAEDVTSDAVVSPAKFEEQMRGLSAAGYTAVTLDDVINYIEKGIDLPEKSVLITFDDGYMSNYEYAYPILKQYGLKAVIFAVGETYGKDTYPGTDVPIYPHFGEDERQEMEASGVIEVQSHTYAMHQNAEYEEGIAYENVLMQDGETDLEYIKRLREDYRQWSELFGVLPRAIAFPHGKSQILTQAILNEYSVKLSFSTEPKADTLLKGVDLSGYSLGRFVVTDQMTAEDVLALLDNA